MGAIPSYDSAMTPGMAFVFPGQGSQAVGMRSEEHTSELQSQSNIVCRLLLEKKNRFLASTLPVPNSTVTRALSIRFGERDEPRVCFETAKLSLRAAWTCDFLKFDAATFGLAY